MKTQKSELIQNILLIICTAACYFLAAKAGLLLATISKQTSPVWPATGIAISFIVVFGYRMAIGVFFAALIANWLTGLSLAPSVFIGLGNTLEALVAVYLFRTILAKKIPLGQYAPLVISIFSILVAATIGSVIGTLTLIIFSVIQVQDFFYNWFTWWIGDILGALIITPLAYPLSLNKKVTSFIKTIHFKKLLFVLLVSASFSYFVFNHPSGSPYFFILFLPLLLSCQLFGSIWTYILSFLICSHAIISTIMGLGPFTGNSLNENLINLQLFLASLSITALGLGSLKKEGLLKLPVIALICGWFISGIASYYFINLAAHKDLTYFKNEIKNAEFAIQERLQIEINSLEVGADFFQASDYISEKDWKIFTQKTLEKNKFHSLLGLGVIYASRTNKVENFYKEVGLKENWTHFRIHSVPLESDDLKVKSPELHYIITYIEPKTKNKPAIGLDISSEKNRYMAAQRARASGEAAMTSTINLVQDSQKRPGFLIYFPFYKSNLQNATDEERMKAIRGFIYAPVLSENFFNAALDKKDSQINLTAYFGQGTEARTPVYISKSEASSSKISIKNELMMAGTPVTLVWTKKSTFASNSSPVASWLGFTGSLSTLFLAILLSSLKSTSQNAEKIAELKTEELISKNQLWKSLTEVSPVGIYLADNSGSCTYINSTLSNLIGLTPQEAYGKGWLNAIHPEDRAALLKGWKDLTNGKKFEHSYRYLKKNNEVSYITSQSVPIKNNRNEITGYIGTVQDMTELHHKQNALIASSRMSSLGEMASGVAHEINNPLTILLGKARKIESLIEQKQFDPNMILENIIKIINTVHRISKIIKGLQAFARETSSENFELVKIQDVIQNTLELCQERFSKHETKLIVDASIPANLTFWGREEQMSQVIMNLLNNAFDAVQKKSEKWVEIKVQKIENKIVLTVTDSGLGIDSSVQENIFNPFYTTKEVGKGTGLGLSISKGIIERHQGRIYFNKNSRNTQFVVEINLYTEQKPDQNQLS